MGLFDSVWITCAKCGENIEFQSKADYFPFMNNYTIETAPKHILVDIEGPFECNWCGEKGKIEVELSVKLIWDNSNYLLIISK
jgi:hypothetical protein